MVKNIGSKCEQQIFSGNVGAWSTLVMETPLGPDTTAPPTVKFIAVPGNTVAQVAWTQVDDTYVSTQIRSGIKRYGINVLYADGSRYFTTYVASTESYANIGYILFVNGVPLPSQGAVYISVFAEDNAGNVSTPLPAVLVVTSAPGLLTDIYPPSLVTNIKVTSGDRYLILTHNSALEGSFANYATSELARHDYRYTTDGVNYTTLTGFNTSRFISGLTNGTQYTIQVRGVDNAGNVGAWSEPVTGTPLGPDTTAPPWNPYGYAIIPSYGSLLVSWVPQLEDSSSTTQRVSGVAGYNIRYYSGLEEPITIFVPNKYTSSYLITGLYHKYYIVALTVVDNAGNESSSIGLQVRPFAPDDKTPPAVPLVNNTVEGNTTLSITYQIPAIVPVTDGEVATSYERYEIEYKT